MLTEDCRTGEKKRKIPLEWGFSEPVAARSRAESESEASGTFQDPSRRNAVEISKEQDLLVNSLEGTGKKNFLNI